MDLTAASGARGCKDTEVGQTASSTARQAPRINYQGIVNLVLGKLPAQKLHAEVGAARALEGPHINAGAARYTHVDAPALHQPLHGQGLGAEGARALGGDGVCQGEAGPAADPSPPRSDKPRLPEVALDSRARRHLWM